jgi:hypothetical protein
MVKGAAIARNATIQVDAFAMETYQQKPAFVTSRA